MNHIKQTIQRIFYHIVRQCCHFYALFIYLVSLLLMPNAFAGGSGNNVFTTPASDMQIKNNQDFLVVLKNFSKSEAFPYLIFILWVLIICGGIGCLLKGNSEYNRTGDVGSALKSIAMPAVMVCLGGILAWYVSSINTGFDFQS